MNPKRNRARDVGFYILLLLILVAVIFTMSKDTELDQVENSMRITFSAHRGQTPRDYIDRLEEACRNGDIYYLYIGGKRVGDDKCYIESIDSEWEEIWSRGELVRASVDVTFKEYT